MVFSSVTFLFYFLPLFFVAYFLTPTTRGKNITTLIFSPGILCVGRARVCFGAARRNGIQHSSRSIYQTGMRGRRARGPWRLPITVNLLLLAVFKYAGFLAASLGDLLRPLGVTVPVPDIRLPLGISFFTLSMASPTLSTCTGAASRRTAIRWRWRSTSPCFRNSWPGPIVRSLQDCGAAAAQTRLHAGAAHRPGAHLHHLALRRRC